MGKTSLVGSIIAGALFLIAGTAQGAGLGKLTVLSHLGEPLRAEIDVVAPEKRELDTLTVRLGSPDAYLQSNLPYPPSSLGLRMTIEHRSSGEPYIKVTSAQPVPEPFVDLLVELNWQGGRILRAYTALLDPPAFAAAPPPAEAPAPKPAAAAPPPRSEPAVETRMGSEMQHPAPETPPAEVAAAPAPAEIGPGEPVPPQPGEQATPVPPAEAGMPPKPEPEPEEESYGPVKRGDTLSKIAMQYKPDDVTLDQMLVLLFRNNKEAFSGNNMNRLKTGKVLTIPDPSEAADIPKKEARKEVRLQVADFNSYRERLASAAGATMPAPAETGIAAGGKITGPVQDKARPSTGEPKEVLKLSQGEAPGTGGNKAMQDKVRGLEEEVAARDKTIRDANERIAKLERTVKDMQGLLELKNKPMAELQKPSVTPPVTPAPAVPPAVIPPTNTEAAPVLPPPAAPATGPMATSGAQPSVAGGEPKPKPKPHPRVVAPPPPPPSSLLDDLLSDPTYLVGGGAVLALILGFLGYRIIRGRRGVTVDDLGAEKKTFDVGALSATGAAAALMAGASPGGAAPPQITEEVDPLAEAEIYLAYGRDGQAEEILREALQSQPRRFEIHLKLLEIFAKRKDVPAFDGVARDLQQATGGQGEIWLQAARLGYAIDPGNPRYAAGKPSPQAIAAAAAAAAATTVTTTDRTLDFQIDSLEPSPEIGTLTDIDAGFGRRFATTTAASASADRLDLNVSVDEGQAPGTKTDIDLGKLSLGTGATAVDLDLDSLGGSPGTGTDINLATFGAEQTAHLPVMDFNLDLPPGGEERTQARMAKVDSVDFDLKLDDGGATPAAEAPLDFDIDRIALETGGTGKAEPMLNLERSGPAMPAIDLSSINLDLDGAGSPEAEGGAKDDKWYDVQTKFDLAKAYQEMGDKEGAREILREVIAEGDAEQKAAAHKVLETLG